ncbi:MAG: hypothetical protein HQK83_15520 [Fibrobacteria bacterium]|nr:hypothetical protein [Fibrobacteria bacterium]
MMQKLDLIRIAVIWLLCSAALFAKHPTGKLLMLEAYCDQISSTVKEGDTHILNLTEFINDGFNGVHMRFWGDGYHDAEKDHSFQIVRELQEAGIWIGTHAPPADDVAGAQKVVKQIIDRWDGHVDFLQVDEPFGSGASPRFWLDTESDYQAVKSVLPSDVPMIISDVYFNSKIWGWNIDGLAQEVYGTSMYPSYLDKVISWRNDKNKPGYVWIGAYNRQMYNDCKVETEDMHKTWTQGAWDADIKMILFRFSCRKEKCGIGCNSSVTNMGNDWPSWQRVARSVTKGTRVKFHEWKNFNPEGIQSLTPDVTIQVRSEEAGLDPSSATCYYTTDYNGRWETEPGKATNTDWIETPCTCTGEKNTKDWQTITATAVPFDAGSKDNMIRFKIRDTYSGKYYRNARWGTKQYAVEIDSNDIASNKYNIFLSNTIVAYDAEPGETIAVLSTLDSNTTDTSFTYSLASGGVDNHLFDIQGNQLKTFSATGYDTTKTYTILLETKDSAGLGFKKEFTITVGLETPTAVRFNKSTTFSHADKVEVIDLQGRVVLELNATNAGHQFAGNEWARLVDESALQMGVYVVRRYNGNKVQAGKVFKK